MILQCLPHLTVLSIYDQYTYVWGNRMDVNDIVSLEVVISEFETKNNYVLEKNYKVIVNLSVGPKFKLIHTFSLVILRY